MFDPFYIIGVLVVVLGIIVILITVMGIVLLKYFPKSNLTKWFRSHIITDEDLEQL
jgi:hypothetical protein